MKATLHHDGSLHLESLTETRIVRASHPSYAPLARLYHERSGTMYAEAPFRLSSGYGGFPWRGGEPDFDEVYDIPLEDLHVDPQRFQFKEGAHEETGVTSELDDEAFDHDRCGELGVWKDHANGKTFVVDGHHRRELGERAGVETMRCRYIDAGSAEEARKAGGKLNGVQLSVADPDDADDPGHDLMADILYGMYGDSALARVIVDNWNAQGITPDTLTEEEVENIKKALHGTNHHIAWIGGKWAMAKSEDAVSLSGTSNWTVHEGKRGGRGWKNTATGEIRYQANAPKERARKDGSAPAPRAKADKPAQAAKPTTESPAQPEPKKTVQPAPQQAAPQQTQAQPKPARKPSTPRAKKGSPEAVATAQKAVSAVLSGQGGVSSDDLVGHLANLTVPQLQALHKQHGVRAPGRLRANLIESVKARNAAIDGQVQEQPATQQPAAQQQTSGITPSQVADIVFSSPNNQLPDDQDVEEARQKLIDHFGINGTYEKTTASVDSLKKGIESGKIKSIKPPDQNEVDKKARGGKFNDVLLVTGKDGQTYILDGTHSLFGAIKSGAKNIGVIKQADQQVKSKQQTALTAKAKNKKPDDLIIDVVKRENSSMLNELRQQMPEGMRGKAFDDTIIRLAEQGKITLYKDAYAENYTDDERKGFVHLGDNMFTSIAYNGQKTSLSTAISPEVQREALRALREQYPLSQLMDGVRLSGFDPSEPRNESGEWTKGGSGGKSGSMKKKTEFKVKPPKKLFRGVMNSGKGAGTYTLGKGLYSTPRKSFLQGFEFDKIVELNPEEAFPKNPLVLRDPSQFIDWLLKESGEKNIRDFNVKYPDPGYFVRSKGFDGVFAGDEVVKYMDEKTPVG